MSPNDSTRHERGVDDRLGTAGRYVGAMDLRFDAGAGRSIGAAEFGNPKTSDQLDEP